MNQNSDIQIHISAPGLQLHAALKLEALAEIVALIQKYRSESPPPPPCPPRPQSEMPPPPFGPPFGPPGSDRQMQRQMEHLLRMQQRIPERGFPQGFPQGVAPLFSLSPEAEAIRSQFKEFAYEKVLNQFPCCTLAEQILLLLAWHEGQTSLATTKRGLKLIFAPILSSNLRRDFGVVAERGLIFLCDRSRAAQITESGWLLALEIMNRDDSAAAAV